MNVLHSRLLDPVQGYSVLFEALVEEAAVEHALSCDELGVDHSESIQGVQDGRYQWFCARITVRKGGIEGVNYLGCCCYASYPEFYIEQYDDYCTDMIAEAILDAEEKSQ